MVFPANSRYQNVDTTTLILPDGTSITYLRRRFLPPPENFAVLQTVSIAAGDRLDNLAARYLGDPEQAWRLCDANRAMQPEALVAYVGATLVITLPEGVPGVGDAG